MCVHFTMALVCGVGKVPWYYTVVLKGIMVICLLSMYYSNTIVLLISCVLNKVLLLLFLIRYHVITMLCGHLLWHIFGQITILCCFVWYYHGLFSFLDIL